MKTPVLYILLPLVAGIAVQSCLPSVSADWCVALCVLLWLLLLPILLRGGGSSWLFGLQLSVVWVAFGFTLATVRQPAAMPNHYAHRGLPTGQIVVQLCEIPHQTDKVVKAQGEVLYLQDSVGWHSCRGRIMLFLERDSAALQSAMGDCLLVTAQVQWPSTGNNPHQFNYRRYLIHKGIRCQSYVPTGQWLLLGHDTRGLRALLARWRLRLLQVVEQADLSPSQQGMASALLLGWKDHVDDENYARFQTSGIAHLLCVSGLHVGIVAALFGWCFSWLACLRRGYLYKGVAQLLGLWLFVALSGMAPSAMRAGIMFSCIIVGRLFFTAPPVLNSVGVSALLLLLIRPGLLFDVGFQLSYAAVVGIVTLCPVLRTPWFRQRAESPSFPYRHWQRWTQRFLGRLYDLLCVTTVAQLATLPFVLHYFHQFPAWFFVANVVVVPCATLLLVSILVMLLMAWWPLAFRLSATVVGMGLRGVEAVIAWVSQLPGALIEHIYCDDVMFALLLAAVLLCCLWAERERPCHWHYLGALLLLLVMLVSYAFLCRHRCEEQRHVVCYDVGHRTAIEVMQGRCSVLYGDSLTLEQPAILDYSCENNAIYHQIKQRTFAPLPHYLLLDTLRLAVVTRADCDTLRRQARLLAATSPSAAVTPLHVHCLILADYAYLSLNELTRLYRFDSVVLASSLSLRVRLRYRELCRTARIPCHDVAYQGAWQH